LALSLGIKIGLYIALFFIFNIGIFINLLLQAGIFINIKQRKYQIFASILVRLLFVYSLIFLFGIWTLTQTWAWNIYLFILLVDLIGEISAYIFNWRIGLYEKDYLEEYHQQKNLANFYSPRFSIFTKFSEILDGFIFGTIIYVVIGVIYFNNSVETNLQTELIILVIVIILSNDLTSLLKSLHQSSSSHVDDKLRYESLVTIGLFIYRFSFITYFILWILNIDIFDVLFSVGPVNFYWFYIVISIALGLFLLVMLIYRIGAKKRKEYKLGNLKNYDNLLHDINLLTNIENFTNSRKALEEYSKYAIKFYNNTAFILDSKIQLFTVLSQFYKVKYHFYPEYRKKTFEQKKRRAMETADKKLWMEVQRKQYSMKIADFEELKGQIFEIQYLIWKLGIKKIKWNDEESDFDKVKNLKNKLKAEINSLPAELFRQQRSLLDHLDQSIIKIVKENSLLTNNSNKELDSTINTICKITEKPNVDYFFLLHKLLSKINYVLNNTDDQSLILFDNWINIEKQSNQNALRTCKEISIFPWKTYSYITFVWTTLNGALGIYLSSILDYFSNIILS